MHRIIKSIFILVILLLSVRQLSAQITITINPINPLRASVTDLFKGGLSNAGIKAERLYLVGTIINTTTGKTIVSARTISKEYAIGYEAFNEITLEPQYTFAAGSPEQTGYLPYGNYEYCVKAYIETNNEEAANTCIDVQVTPITPPLLINPENKSEINTLYPLLIWLGPTPINPGVTVVYDLKLVELMQNQSPYDAVQRNFALLEQGGIPATNLQYPANAMQLEEGKTYAWKILARTTDGNMIGETEVWTFKVATPEVEKKDSNAVNKNFIIPKRQRDGHMVYISDELRIYFDETPVPTKMNFAIYDSKNKSVDTSGVEVINMGLGKFRIMLDDKLNLKNGEYYTFVAKLGQGEERYIFFRYTEK